MASLGGNTAIIITRRRQGTLSTWYKCFNKMKTCLILTLVIRNEKTIVLYLWTNSFKLLFLIDLTYFSLETKVVSIVFFSYFAASSKPLAPRCTPEHRGVRKRRKPGCLPLGTSKTSEQHRKKKWQRAFLRCIAIFNRCFIPIPLKYSKMTPTVTDA